MHNTLYEFLRETGGKKEVLPRLRKFTKEIGLMNGMTAKTKKKPTIGKDWRH